MNRLHLIFVSTILLEVSPSYGSESVSTYDNNLGEVIGFAKGIATSRNFCNEQFPELAAQNSDAYSDWQHRNEPALTEVNARWSKQVEELARQVGKTQAETLALLDAQARRAEDAFRVQSSHLPSDRLRMACSQLHQSLMSPESDVEVAMKRQLTSIRTIKPRQ